MTRNQLARLDMFVRVDQFGAAYADQFPAGSAGREAFDAVRASVTALTQDAATRVSRRMAGVNQRPVARDVLATQLDAIARTARLIAKTSPGFAEPFQLPRPVKYGVVLSSAHAFLRDAEPMAAQFMARGLSATFIDDLRQALTAFEQARQAREAATVERSSALEGIRRAVTAGMDAVAAIELIVRYQFAANGELQAAWRRARLIGSRRRAQAAPATASTGTPVPQSSLVAATAGSTSSPPEPVSDLTTPQSIAPAA